MLLIIILCAQDLGNGKVRRHTSSVVTDEPE